MKCELTNEQLIIYYNDIPIGKDNAVNYEYLSRLWNKSYRSIRRILHQLSKLDIGDDYILIRSSKEKGGFYKSNDLSEILSYKKECLNMGRSTLAPLKKINRIIKDNSNSLQVNLFNNLKSVRISRGLKQIDVVRIFKKYGEKVDEALLSKFENSVCLPTPKQLFILTKIYECDTSSLILISGDGVDNLY